MPDLISLLEYSWVNVLSLGKLVFGISLIDSFVVSLYVFGIWVDEVSDKILLLENSCVNILSLGKLVIGISLIDSFAVSLLVTWI